MQEQMKKTIEDDPGYQHKDFRVKDSLNEVNSPLAMLNVPI
jgi:hypothetical protein